MGNHYAPDPKLIIDIETQKPYYNSGSSIQGTVFVQANKNFQFNTLYLRIQGNQQCQWFEGSSKNRRKYTGTGHFYMVQHILFKYQDACLQKGKYAYPFSIQLSDNIPGSFQSNQRNAKIEYHLTAYFVNYKNKQRMQLYQQPIIIRQPFRQQVVKYSGQVIETPKKFGFFQQGQIRLQVHFDRNVAYQGQQIQISILADNTQGKSNINKFFIQLVQYTFVSSNGNASRTYRKLVQKKVLDQNLIKGEQRNFQTKFKIPNIKYQTAISTLVANYYRLQVSTDLGIGISNNPSIYAPIFIIQKTVQTKGKIMRQINEQHNMIKPVCLRAGDYLFKKNRNLQIFNFKNDDIVTQSHYGSQNTFQ